MAAICKDWKKGATAIGAMILATLPVTGAFAQAPTTTSDWASNEFISKAKGGATLRSSFFERSKPNETGPAAEAWGVGGWIGGETGELGNIFSLGGNYYFVGKAYGPKDGGGNFILDDQQSGYSVLGEGWGRLRFGDHALTVGRQALNYGWALDGVYRFYNRYDGSFIGRRDVRAMTPLNFESATVNGKFANGNVRYYGGYAWEMRQINSDTFEDLAKAALDPGDSDGMAFVGAQWKISNDLMLQGSYHHVENLLSMSWVDLDYVFRLGGDRYLRFDTQYIYQGANRSTKPGATPCDPLYCQNEPPGEDRKTWNWAGYVEGRWWPWLIGYGMIGVTADDDEIRSPYSLGPSYLVQRIGENAKAGEFTWILGATFELATLGAPGLSFDINYGQRSDRHVAQQKSQPLSDWNELATDLVYTIGKGNGWLSGTRMRFRWAKVWEKGEQFSSGVIVPVDQKQTDLRFDIQVPVSF